MRGCACISLLGCLCLLLAACATIGPPQPPSLKLPKPPSDLRARRKGDIVHLTWTVPTQTTDRQSVRALGPTRICRDLESPLSQCGTPVGEATSPSRAAASKSPDQKTQQKIENTYADSLSKELERDNPLGFAIYAVEVLNSQGRGAGPSNQVRVPLAETLALPGDFKAGVTAQGVVLTWTGEVLSGMGETVRYVYRVYRRPESSQQQILVGEAPAGSERNFTVPDSSIEWEQTYYYHAEAVTVIALPDKAEVQVEGDDTAEVKVFAHDIFPPAVPAGLQAVFSGPGQQPFIDLIWAPVTDLDLAGYNVYRREGERAWVKLNTEPVKTPAYRDTNVVSGKSYSYAVSAVDGRGNESARSEEAAESVP